MENLPINLEEERAKLDAIFSSIGDGALSTDEEGRVVRINNKGLNLLGYTAEEVIGAWYPKIMDASDELGNKLSGMQFPITKSLLNGEPVSQRVIYKKKDGSSLPVSVTVSPVILNGRPIGAVEIFHDITEELSIERSKNEFISIASHQLKTPPGALKWDLELLGDGTLGPVTDKQREVLDEMRGVADKMLETVNALLNVSRLELGTFIIDPKPVNYSLLTQSIVKELESRIKEKKQILHEIYDPLVPEIPADPGLANVVLDNLIGNAIKYTPPEGEISVSIVFEKETQEYPIGSILITIKDSGYGIPEKDHGRIFSKMFRAENVSDIEGTGFGLYITKTIVEISGGTIWFTSVEKKGTTFFVRLPLSGMHKKEGTSKIMA